MQDNEPSLLHLRMGCFCPRGVMASQPAIPTMLLLMQRGWEEMYPTPLTARVMSWLVSKLKTDFPYLDIMALPMWWHSSPLMAIGIFAYTGDYSSITYVQDCVGDRSRNSDGVTWGYLKHSLLQKYLPIKSYHFLVLTISFIPPYKGTPLAGPNNFQVLPRKFVPKAYHRFCSVSIGKTIHAINVYISQDNWKCNAYCNH